MREFEIARLGVRDNHRYSPAELIPELATTITHALQRKSLQTCRVTARRKPAAYLRELTRRRASQATLRRGLAMRRRRGRTRAHLLPHPHLTPRPRTSLRAPATPPAALATSRPHRLT
ncbi:hypothetical protein KGM_211923 [Danaus plexippus plexippus]|uniref:Uncharacterized protein n=1 Tax=Danaus plexippus plexippus TaxID=278856 RepID=A0A212ETT7_DANPL|nr:hypothetical protein KGM_211923 [Danaus plexippus plexippus]